jgi:threonine 3-dehydrogenase
MAGLLESGLDLNPIVTHELPVARFQEGFDLMRSGASGKVVLDWGSGSLPG